MSAVQRLIVLDIDGTLYNDNQEILPSSSSILEKVQENGIKLVLASGRPLSSLKVISKRLKMDWHHGLLIGYNGGNVMDCTDGSIIYANTIPVKQLVRLLEHLESYPVTPIIDDGEYIYTNDPQGFKIPYESATNYLKIKEVGSLKSEITFSPPKVLIAAPEEILAKHKDEIIAPFAGILEFSMSAPFYLEVTPKGTDKAEALKIACEKLDIPAENVIAFGDGANDISMLEYAGIGVAMGNAPDTVKEIADMVTLSNNEDGIEAAINLILYETK